MGAHQTAKPSALVSNAVRERRGILEMASGPPKYLKESDPTKIRGNFTSPGEMALAVPARLAANCGKTREQAAWLERLPSTVRELERRWSLSLGAPFDCDEVSCAWVAPAKRADGTAAVRKLGMPHMEGEHEIQGLRFWDGN